MTDIANSERIFLVMKAGVLYDRSRIEGLKAEAEALVSEREAELAEKARPPAQQQ
jgi:predicted transcriptional regulator